MHNLFWEIDKINRDEWASRLAEMRVYTTKIFWVKKLKKEYFGNATYD